MMHQSEFYVASVALSRAADKRKLLINIHKNRYTATLREQTTGESCPHARTSLSGMTRGRTRLYLSLDKLERTSWSYTGHMLCASIVPLDALMVGKARLVGDADARMQ